MTIKFLRYLTDLCRDSAFASIRSRIEGLALQVLTKRHRNSAFTSPRIVKQPRESFAIRWQLINWLIAVTNVNRYARLLNCAPLRGRAAKRIVFAK